MAKENNYKWTVFFLIKTGDDSTQDAITMINELRNISFSETISITFCVNVNRSNVKAIETGDFDHLSDEDVERTTIFYRLKKATSNLDTFINILERIAENRDLDIRNANDLKNAFKQYITKAERFMLFTWDHGRPYGIFKRRKDDIGEIASIDVREDSVQVLTMDELSEAINGAFGRKQVDILIMMNCYMQVADTGYALKEAVHYLVASEGLIDLTGYNYNVIFNTLSDNPNISGKELAYITVQSFPEKVLKFEELISEYRENIAIFASDLGFMDFTSSVIDMVAKLLIKALPAEKDYILKLHEMSSVTKHPLIDFYTFVQNLDSSHINNIDIGSSIVMLQKKLFLINSYVGNEFSRFSGMSLFFPNMKFSDIPYTKFKPYTETSFWKDSTWRAFLQKALQE